ncbi:hypothetical protein PPERSA_08909 [Pseudocohnilembus persalinus]|uniref:Uncharacterized protein n=1 Tax=Pseudocohnilembus persalinus TaxID=266149 RepID=A0A0V0R3L4_PSEPJ|nr:hypothetical protein PPERSA_08909 [Pseudocohnilembus persalinus]|eukprot:KRX08805.1 hypothetical protein PPERSA_08909 [Pseudocohnilembus persalinus]
MKNNLFYKNKGLEQNENQQNNIKGYLSTIISLPSQEIFSNFSTINNIKNIHQNMSSHINNLDLLNSYHSSLQVVQMQKNSYQNLGSSSYNESKKQQDLSQISIQQQTNQQNNQSELNLNNINSLQIYPSIFNLNSGSQLHCSAQSPKVVKNNNILKNSISWKQFSNDMLILEEIQQETEKTDSIIQQYNQEGQTLKNQDSVYNTIKQKQPNKRYQIMRNDINNSVKNIQAIYFEQINEQKDEHLKQKINFDQINENVQQENQNEGAIQTFNNFNFQIKNEKQHRLGPRLSTSQIQKM